MKRTRRLASELWAIRRQEAWERDAGRCQGPYCRQAPPRGLHVVHIDHIVPLSSGGCHCLDNLRTLCRRCHVLRAHNAHRGMIAAALRDGIIPANWRPLIWEDA